MTTFKVKNIFEQNFKSVTLAVFLDFVHKKGCTDRRTDRQTNGHLYKNNMLPQYVTPRQTERRTPLQNNMLPQIWYSQLGVDPNMFDEKICSLPTKRNIFSKLLISDSNSKIDAALLKSLAKLKWIWFFYVFRNIFPAVLWS